MEHPRFTSLYPRVAARADERGAAEHRRRLVDGLAEELPFADGSLDAAGFDVEACERFGFRSAPLEPRLAYILGRARRQ